MAPRRRRGYPVCILRLATLGVLGTVSQAQAASNIPPVLISPDGNLAYELTVELPQGVSSATVRLLFPPEACDLLVLCDLPPAACDTTPAFTAMADAAGNAIFHIVGGGCWDPGEISTAGSLIQVQVDGQTVAFVGVRSPDWVDSSGLSPWELWCEIDEATVGLGDATAFTEPLRTGVYTFCVDLDDNGIAGLPDAVMVTDYITGGATCQEQ